MATAVSMIRIAVAAGILAFGFFTCRGGDAWSDGFLLLYMLPLVLQFALKGGARVWALWFGAALVAQTLVTLVFPDHYMTRRPGTRTVQVYNDPEFKPGITGTHVVTTDQMGFRTLPHVDYLSKKGYRIFVIGGSTTEDAALDDSLTWTHKLQLRLEKNTGRKIEVINTGLAGARAIQNLATMERVSAFEPDLMIIYTGANDWIHHMGLYAKKMSWVVNSANDPWLPENTLLGRALKRASLLLTGTEKNAERTTETRHEWGPPSRHQGDDSLARARKIEFKPEKVHAEFPYILAAMADHCLKGRFKCIFVTNAVAYALDVQEGLKKKFWMTPIHGDYTFTLESLVHLKNIYNNEVSSVARRRGIALCDAATRIPATLEYFYDDSHFNRGGAEKMAGIVEECVLKMPDAAGIGTGVR